MSLTQEYLLLVFIAAMGFIQFAAVRGGLKGLMFIQNFTFNRALAYVLMVPVMMVFFTWNYRNPVGIIEGAQQAGLFSLASVAALVATLVIASVINHAKIGVKERPQSGLDALKDSTFFQAIRSRYFWRS